MRVAGNVFRRKNTAIFSVFARRHPGPVAKKSIKRRSAFKSERVGDVQNRLFSFRQLSLGGFEPEGVYIFARRFAEPIYENLCHMTPRYAHFNEFMG